MQKIREAVAGLISAAIVVVSIWILVVTFKFGRQVYSDANVQASVDAYNRQKDILLYALGLLGTVIGYYLGRVPAELHAEQAHVTATKAQERLGHTQDKLTDAASIAVGAVKERDQVKTDAKEMLNRVLLAVEGLQQSPKLLGEAASPGSAEAERLQHDIREFLRRL